MMRKAEPKSYDATISAKGFRFTEQRRQVYDALMARRDHPTAVEVFMRVKSKMSSISLATVYNCLETLTECGLVKHVHHDRESSRYCPNLDEHAHLFCESCNSVTDLPLRVKRRTADIWDVPADVVISRHEVSFRGLCAKCTAREAKRGTRSLTLPGTQAHRSSTKKL
jgi:Fe2+ or Zn2+ uptake regulation protein